MVQLLVLRDRLAELASGLEQPFLESAHPARRILQALTQDSDLVLELALQLVAADRAGG